MAKKVSDPHKYINRSSINGQPPEKGKVLVPYWIQDGSCFNKNEIIEENCTTYHFGEFRFIIGFIPINIGKFDDYMEYFWSEINSYIKNDRTGRCVLNHKPNEEPICYPKSRFCMNCPNSREFELYNPHKDRFRLISLEQLAEDADFDMSDPFQPVPEDIVCSQTDLSEDEHYEIIIARLEKDNPRYAEIVRLSKQKVPVNEICEKLDLKTGREREEITNAFNACCDLLNLSCYKKKKKKM